MKDIIEQLVEIYYQEEWWHKNKMSYEIAYNYHKKLYELGNIQTCEVDNKVLGYVESWKINFEQFGRLICQERFCADVEDVNSGNIAYVANVWINPNYRKGFVYKELKVKFFERNCNCDFFVGEALRKKTQPIKVFKKSELSSSLFKQGVTNG